MICTITMTKQNHLLSLARFTLPVIGLSLVFVGAYIRSIQNEDLQSFRNSTYLFIFLGFILLVIWVLWSVGHAIKSVLFKRSLRRLQNTDVSIFTIDRFSLNPPSYDESQVRYGVIEEIDLIPTVIQFPVLAPPVYTESYSGIISEDFSHEEPPTYHPTAFQRQPDIEAICQPNKTKELL